MESSKIERVEPQFVPKTLKDPFGSITTPDVEVILKAGQQPARRFRSTLGQQWRARQSIAGARERA